MESKISHLRKFIEEMRKDLIQLSNSHNSFTHPEVVSLSQKLDRLLDEYQELTIQPKIQTIWLEWLESDDMPSVVTT